MSHKPDELEALFGAAAGVFLVVCDALDAAAAQRAVDSLREYANDFENPLGADLCRGMADVAAGGLYASGSSTR